MRSVRVLVVGGGIGGLSAARALRSAGAKVRVYEQAAELGEVGAGVGMFPNRLPSRSCGVAGARSQHEPHAGGCCHGWQLFVASRRQLPPAPDGVGQ